MKTYGGTGCTVPRILDLGTGWRCGLLHIPDASVPRIEPPVAIRLEAGWREENLTPTGTSAPTPSAVKPFTNHVRSRNDYTFPNIAKKVPIIYRTLQAPKLLCFHRALQIT
jgi:hypothetical protein